MLRTVFLVSAICLVQGCASVSKINTSGTWHFMPVNNNLSLISSSIVESGKMVGLGASMSINILCKYGVSSISNDCMTSFIFTRYPENFGTFRNKLEAIPTDVAFLKKGKREQRQLSLYPVSDGIMMIAPDQVDSFLSILSTSDEVTVYFKWKIIKAIQDEEHGATFTFKLNKTPIAIGRFKNQVLDKSSAKIQQPIKPKKKVSEIVANYI